MVSRDERSSVFLFINCRNIQIILFEKTIYDGGRTGKDRVSRQYCDFFNPSRSVSTKYYKLLPMCCNGTEDKGDFAYNISSDIEKKRDNKRTNYSEFFQSFIVTFKKPDIHHIPTNPATLLLTFHIIIHPLTAFNLKNISCAALISLDLSTSTNPSTPTN